jgi:hypothetical protein
LNASKHVYHQNVALAVYCLCCDVYLGWKYEEAFEQSQKYNVPSYPDICSAMFGIPHRHLLPSPPTHPEPRGNNPSTRRPSSRARSTRCAPLPSLDGSTHVYQQAKAIMWPRMIPLRFQAPRGNNSNGSKQVYHQNVALAVYCLCCDVYLGWKYEEAFEQSRKYKVCPASCARKLGHGPNLALTVLHVPYPYVQSGSPLVFL